MQEIIDNLKHRFSLQDVTVKRGNLAFVTVPVEQAVASVGHLRDSLGYTHLVFLTAVDIIERGVFRLAYMLHNYQRKDDICIHVELPRDGARMESIHHLWAQAATYQRELKEMYGIDFPGSPRVDEAFALEGWQEIPPMRRDFDTKEYSEKTYFPRPGRVTYDTQEYMKEKLYGEEQTT